jgi:hypothetical protein
VRLTVRPPRPSLLSAASAPRSLCNVETLLASPPASSAPPRSVRDSVQRCRNPNPPLASASRAEGAREQAGHGTLQTCLESFQRCQVLRLPSPIARPDVASELSNTGTSTRTSQRRARNRTGLPRNLNAVGRWEAKSRATRPGPHARRLRKSVARCESIRGRVPRARRAARSAQSTCHGRQSPRSRTYRSSRHSCSPKQAPAYIAAPLLFPAPGARACSCSFSPAC